MKGKRSVCLKVFLTTLPAIMTNFTTLQFPAQMRPELAHHVAMTLCWAPEDSSFVSATSLCLLYASWHANKPERLSQFATRLERALRPGPEKLMAALVDPASYKAQGVKHGLGELLLNHISQGIEVWSERINTLDSAKLFKGVIESLRAASMDTTERAEHMATSVVDFIAMHPEHGDEGGPGLFIQGPQGQPLGPFPSKKAAMAYQREAMAALSRGLPLPPIPGQDTAPVEFAQDALPDGPCVHVYSRDEAVNQMQRLPPPAPGEGNGQQRRLLEAMANSEGLRPLTEVPDGEPLAAMYRDFPHFTEVLDFVARRLALAGCGSEGRPVKFPPILLRGVDGTGKSYFAKRLAKALGTYYVERDFAATGAVFSISGMDSGYKGSKPGIVFEAVVNGKSANPLICFNEIDKPASSEGGGPMGSLYTLLEPESSMNFTDAFVPVPVDVSHVLWVCTANEGVIPTPILGRLRVFEIKEPTREQCRTIAVSVWESIYTSVLPAGHGFPRDLGEPFLDAMSVMRPRDMRKTLEDAAGEAVFSGRKVLTLGDLAISTHQNARVTGKPMGFVH